VALAPDMSAPSRRPESAAGDVHLSQDALWLPEFFSELLAFPNGRHDDQVDIASQVPLWWQGQRFMSKAPIVALYVFSRPRELPS
jgi:phage terminase large subunit-like protein